MRPLLRPGHVLVVDDNEVNALVVGAMLETMGCRVQAVESGEQALVLLTEASFDMVLMDCQMPGMDGYEATRRIRREGGKRRLPIVALTANGDRERCLQAGMDDYLTKPVTAQALRQAIDRWVPKRQG
jgi:CheY-like chemotaxis protein